MIAGDRVRRPGRLSQPCRHAIVMISDASAAIIPMVTQNPNGLSMSGRWVKFMPNRAAMKFSGMNTVEMIARVRRISFRRFDRLVA